ncbi:MAG: LarC family nickel insertion protein [Proteobacteria bacterium]|nr:LarC family nickel insertion protein [Pseudomonadota bacterium]
MTKLAHRIHLDPIGGISGDMFVAALADAFPELIPGLLAEVKKLPAPAGADIRFIAHRDAFFGGRQFHVGVPAGDHQSYCGQSDRYNHAQNRGDHVHSHTDYRDIRTFLHETPLCAPVLEHTLGLFAVLAEAEAKVHGIEIDNVAFHEIGAWDSIVDFVAAAFLIDAIGPAQWTFAPFPLGGGRVSSAHGVLPVPAPATILLLHGMQVIDDGIKGERVTPTGAAIVKYLYSKNSAPLTQIGMLVTATGNGFGTRILPGLSNTLRCMAFRTAPDITFDEEIFVACFEIDDQTTEELALALDRLREEPGVLEVYQAPLFGKKGRMAIQVQILARPENIETIAEFCLTETSTLGLRLTRVSRKIVPRSIVTIDEPKLRVKVAQRPSGRHTAKAEIDDLAGLPGGKVARDAARHVAESKATSGKRS